MKNQNEITEKIGEVQIEIEAIKPIHCGCRSFECQHRHDIEQQVINHKSLLAFQSALIWVLDMKV